MKVAVLDLGSTTFHLQHVLVERGAVLGCTLDEKISLRLGEHVALCGGLDDATERRIVEAVDRLVRHSGLDPEAELIAVATSPFRDARNGGEVLSRLRARGLAVQLLTAADEAELAFVGNAQADAGRLAVVDLGGGSADVAVGDGLRCRDTRSAPIGAVRMKELVAPGRPFDREAHVVLRDALLDVSDGAMAGVRALAPERLVFASGTARAVRALALRASTGPIDRAALARSLERYLGCTTAELTAVGVGEARASSVLVATAIMLLLMDAAGMPKAWVSDRGLRQGVALRHALGATAERVTTAFHTHG